MSRRHPLARSGKEARENKPALVAVLLEISFVFSPDCIYTSISAANKEKYSD